MKRMALLDRHLATNGLLDVPQISLLFRIAKRDRCAIATGPGGAANSVDIALGNVWQIEVDHVGDLGNVDAACRNVSCNQRPDPTAAEALERPLASSLRLVAMDRLDTLTRLA